MEKDEYVRVLDFLPHGKSDVPSHKRKPIAQVIGETKFSLLEVIPKPGKSLSVGERVYIGSGPRDKIDHIERRIKYEWLTPTAKSELPFILETLVREQEEKYVNFYNTAGIISPRLHKLETLPKIGKRHRQDILEERSIKPFESFEDMQKRVKNLSNPAKAIADKIIEELQGKSKYMLFVPPMRERMSRETKSR